MSHGIMTKPVDITYIKKHDACFEPLKDCLFIYYIKKGIIDSPSLNGVYVGFRGFLCILMLLVGMTIN